MNFNKEYWKNNIKTEIGLSHVPDEQLHEHFVLIGSFFGDDSNKIRADEYLETQLKQIEEGYKNFGVLLNDLPQEEEYPPTRPDSVEGLDQNELKGLGLDLLDNFIPPKHKFKSSENNGTRPVTPDNFANVLLNKEIKLLTPVNQEIKRESIRYFDVDVNGNHFTVALNFDPSDIKSQDQVNHIKTTSYFIEERQPNFLTGFENIISYYQYANLIQYNMKKNDDVQDKIAKEVKTTFDGFQAEESVSKIIN